MSNIAIPTEVSECLHFLDEEEIQQAFGLMNGSLDPESIPGVPDFIRQCYNRPSENEIRIKALGLLSNSDIETTRLDEPVATVFNPGDDLFVDACNLFYEDFDGVTHEGDGFRVELTPDVSFDYLNFGDPYLSTIVLYRDKFYLSDPGSFAASCKQEALLDYLGVDESSLTVNAHPMPPPLAEIPSFRMSLSRASQDGPGL